MTEANKNTFKSLAFIFGGFGLYILFVHVVPDDSLTKKIMAVLMCVALVFSVLWFTALGNPIKRLIRKFMDKKK